MTIRARIPDFLKTHGPLKLIALSSAGLIVSYGLCGAAGALNDSYGPLAAILGVVGVLACPLSAAGLLVGVLWAIWSLLAAISGRRKP